MRRHLLRALPVVIALGIVVVDHVRAGPRQTFVLETGDKLIAEAPGCHVSCGIQSPVRRECAVREGDCDVICQPIPECRPNGLRPITVCAVVKQGRN